MLLFLVVGMLFGSDGLGLQFHNAKEAQFIGMVALSIILFSGGMDTKFTEIKPILSPGIVLSTFGVLLTALFTGLFIWWLSGMSWTNIHLPLITSLLLASTMSSTDSASVFAILRSQKCPMLYLPLFLNDAVPEEHKSGIDMGRDLLRRSRVLVVCGSYVNEAVKNDIAVAQRLGITATTLDGILTVKGQRQR